MIYRYIWLFIYFHIFVSIYDVDGEEVKKVVHVLPKDDEAGIVLTQDMFAYENAVYIIKYDFDLKGDSIRIPPKCKLIFQHGSINNGSVFFNDTWLDKPKFGNMHVLLGNVTNKFLDAGDFHCQDDTDLFRFLLGQKLNGQTIQLKNKIYTINSLKYATGKYHNRGFIEHRNENGLRFIGNGAIIIDKYKLEQIGASYYAFLQFDRCSDIVLEDFTYICEHKAVLDPKVKGISVVRTFNECKSFTLHYTAINAGRTLYSGKFGGDENAGRGLCDSKIDLRSYGVGYPIAIEIADNLHVKSYFEVAHRGAYLAGVKNSEIYIEGKEAYSTKVNLLLTDGSDANGCYFCDNLDVTVIDTGTSELSDLYRLAVIQIYNPEEWEQFKGRKPYCIKSIRLHLFSSPTVNKSVEVFQFTDLAKLGDEFSNVTIDGQLRHVGGNNRLFRFLRLPKANVYFKGLTMDNNYIVQNEDIPNDFSITFDSCDKLSFDFKSQKIQSNAIIKFQSCTFNRFVKSLKENAGHFVTLLKK